MKLSGLTLLRLCWNVMADGCGSLDVNIIFEYISEFSYSSFCTSYLSLSTRTTDVTSTTETDTATAVAITSSEVIKMVTVASTTTSNILSMSTATATTTYSAYQWVVTVTTNPPLNKRQGNPSRKYLEHVSIVAMMC
jgi:hypothetical protein